MIINYKELNFSSESSSDLIFLKNRNLWLFLTRKNSFYFGGFYLKNNKAFKFLHSLNLPNFREVDVISPQEILAETDNNQFFISLNEENEIEIRSLYSYQWKITFDSNYLFNTDPFLRNIKIEKTSSCFVRVSYFFDGENVLNAFFETSCPMKLNEKWIKTDLDLEKERNSHLREWWIFDGLETNSSYLKIRIFNEERKFPLNLFHFSNSLIINFLLRRIEGLVLNNYLPAGFPWFFENWYRDELLSLLFIKDFLRERKKLFSKYIYNLENKWNLNKEGGNEAVDTLLLILVNLDEEDFFSYFNIFKKYLNEWKKKYFFQEKFSFPPKSTWMDTLERETALEIFAIYLLIIKLFYKKERTYSSEINTLINLIKREIQKSTDPNLPFVFYFVPEIFSRKDWENIFDIFLRHYFLDWGGISTARKDRENFHEVHTGENPLSYHSGDSWYFLNNLTAYALNLINPNKYENEIRLIVKSSLVDLLKSGAIGYSSELSSARERRSEGCLVQTWSMASLVKLLSSFKNPDIFLESLRN